MASHCRYDNVKGVPVFIPGCVSGANSGGALCACPKPLALNTKADDQRAEIATLVATVDELGRMVRALEKRVRELETKGTIYGG